MILNGNQRGCAKDLALHLMKDENEKVEKRLGLEGQLRAIVFHEKDGRRHCHVV